MVVILSWFIQSLIILLSVAFFTLFERKVIGLFHLRLGPNKVSFVGLLQPLLDAFKLLRKQIITPLHSNSLSYNLSPLLSLFLSLFIWTTVPNVFIIFRFSYSILLFFSVRSIIVFGVLLGGWSANSKYSLIGSLRSISQRISYEVVFRTLLITVTFIMFRFSLSRFKLRFNYLSYFILPVWLICTLAEAHRAPFDFSESESELVSGFNTEYSGLNFALVFLSEYSMLLYSCILMSVIYPPMFIINRVVFFTTVAIFYRFLFIWIRITFCRFRYDKLMSLSWKVLLPFTILLYVVIVGVCLSF